MEITTGVWTPDDNETAEVTQMRIARDAVLDLARQQGVQNPRAFANTFTIRTAVPVKYTLELPLDKTIYKFCEENPDEAETIILTAAIEKAKY